MVEIVNVPARTSRSTGLVARLIRWWFGPLPRGRVAALRTVLYLFIFVDVLFTTSWVADHGLVPGELYQPIFLGRLLSLPTPGPLFVAVWEVVLLTCAAIAATGRWPRLLGTAVFVLYFEWMFIAMSYGKVDHDRFAFLVALAVLPTAGLARWGDRTGDERSGWAIRTIQLAVVLTYFLSVFAKLRFGGLEWLNSATLVRAVIRRGTAISDPLLEYPWILQAAQYEIILLELTSPLLLVPGRVERRFLIAAVIFHIVTFSTIGIIFLPHVMCLLSFVELERLPNPAAAIRSSFRRPMPSGRT